VAGPLICNAGNRDVSLGVTFEDQKRSAASLWIQRHARLASVLSGGAIGFVECLLGRGRHELTGEDLSKRIPTVQSIQSGVSNLRPSQVQIFQLREVWQAQKVFIGHGTAGEAEISQFLATRQSGEATPGDARLPQFQMSEFGAFCEVCDAGVSELWVS
jgi:hypothetical protein